MDLLELPQHMQQLLQASVADFISENKWNIPDIFYKKYTDLGNLLARITTPVFNEVNQLIWQTSSTRILSFKEAFLNFQPVQSHCSWSLIWSLVIPPSKSFVAWRLLHNKIATDDQLQKRRCNLSSICSLCSFKCWNYGAPFPPLCVCQEVLAMVKLNYKIACRHLFFSCCLVCLQQVLEPAGKGYYLSWCYQHPMVYWVC